MAIVGAFPAAKLGALLLKQISKPLANAMKRRAKENPFFRTYICMPPAQFYHWCEVKLKMWSMNLGKPVNIPKLTESSAIDLGAELVGEGIMFITAAVILILEYARSSRKEALKESQRVMEMSQVKQDLKDLFEEKARQDAQILELVRILELQQPEASFSPKPIDQTQIPEHHRDIDLPEETGAMATVKGWVWKAVDLVLPEKAGTEGENSRPHIIVIHHKPPPENCECPPTKPSSSQEGNDKTTPGSSDSNNNPNQKR
ncbi:unnamed protein product [Orchesella dallaii]|uniref:OPA3-like protein CG13603 n=1 Tax=Orchesella dallaii TaxID=48710 RepID=A0ABP1REX7_9HEXA